MASELTEDVVAKTTKCEFGHSCLDSSQHGDKPLCKIDCSYGHILLNAKADLNKPCPYRIFFGYGHICACPVHSAICSK